MVQNQQQPKDVRQAKEARPLKREISSGVIVFRKFPDGPRYLLLYRGHNQWTFPRGKIEGEERSFAAAIRETREETGLGRNDLRFVDYFKAYENWTFVKNNEKIHKTVILYLAETHKKQVRIEEDFEGFAWFPYEQAMRIFVGAKNSENRKILDLVHGFLTKSPARPPRGGPSRGRRFAHGSRNGSVRRQQGNFPSRPLGADRKGAPGKPADPSAQAHKTDNTQ